MKRLRTSARLALLAILAGALQATVQAKDSGKDEHKEQPIVWQEKVVPGPGVALRLKRAPGKSLIYEGTIERSQQATASYTEEGSFYLTVACVEQNGGLDQVAIQRTYLDRKRNEVRENGKKVDRVLENTSDLVNLGPNFSIIGTARCYAFDAQNRVAYRTEQLLTLKDGRQLRGSVLSEEKDKTVFLTADDKVEVPRADVASLSSIPQPHVCINDTPHYLFPLFPERQVSPGDTWKFKVPLIIPIEQGAPVRVLPSQFTASLIGRLREVRQSGASQVATVDYQISGVFDSEAAEYRDRFPAAYHEMSRVVHKLSGTGTVVLDIEKGRILEKTESFNITLFGSALIPQPAGKEAKREEKHADISSRYHIKLLAPGTRLKNGRVIPNSNDE